MSIPGPKTETAAMWTKDESGRFMRSDGALVWKGDDYHSNPLNPRCRMWEASGPGVSDTLYKAQRRDRRERFVTRRRFGSADAAMKAVDRTFPIKDAIS